MGIELKGRDLTPVRRDGQINTAGSVSGVFVSAGGSGGGSVPISSHAALSQLDRKSVV